MINPYLKLFYKPALRNALDKGIDAFHYFDAAYFSKLLKSEKPSFWQKNGERMALALFKAASARVPAYKDFLKRNKINPGKIKNISDFKQLPQTKKDNYLRFYPLEKLCWDGKLSKNTLLSVSSGSSGAPFFWPRGDNLELETSISHEMFLKDIFEADRRSTLFIVTFSMGIYIAGTITFNSVLRAAQKKYPITVITPGINLDETLRIVKEMGNKFEQIIISGYPPFVKDIIEKGENEGMDWKKFRVKFLFATEGFSEVWREYVLEKVGNKDLLKSSLNIYGSADAGILGHETPLSIFLRRKDPGLFIKNDIMPTVVQYNPLMKFFEETGSKWVIVDAGIEHELKDLNTDEKKEFRSELGGKDDGIDDLIKKGYELLDLITYFTTGEDETRAWTIKKGWTAPLAGTAIHNDFKDKFIRAEVIEWTKLLEAGSYASARERGLVRTEGKEYLVQDGDVVEFKI